VFKRVLVANRGEIARRVIRTLHVLGVEAVVVHSDVDRGEPFVREADLAIAIGGEDAASSYLDAKKILAAAKAAGAEAIHPGYGFLSESPEFARACEGAGLRFVGPGPDAIAKLGDKKSARELAAQVGVQVVPGGEVGADNRAARELAKRIGFPVLIKSAGGGGGKGMRRVGSLDEMDEALSAARRESRAAFGTDALILEKLVEGARHVEVQVLGDGDRVLPVLERDCSLQRRHQKVVEECPSPRIDGAVRTKLLADAAKLATAGGYENAGTLEFLLTSRGDLYFLEVNARLQVEHPVTEMVCGLDLVGWQLAIASGVRFTQRALVVEPRGCAIEARICAEDPASGFLPQSGTVVRARWPAGPGVRVDAGVESGSVVTPHFDSLLAKVIAWGSDRDEARRRLLEALRQTLIVGVTTNLPFLVATLGSARFRTGDYETKSIERGEFVLDPTAGAPPEDVLVLAASAPKPRPAAPPSTAAAGAVPADAMPGPFDATDAFRMVQEASPG
jgi:acetyl/propionyl-CoA carboxylase alpha subunit